jgi:hypothetical protein
MTEDLPHNTNQKLLERYADFIIDHNVGLRRTGIATFIAGLPVVWSFHR